MKFLKKRCYVPKYEKVSDKMMLSRLLTSTSTIIACLIALSYSAYAWFSFNVSSGTNTILASTLDINVGIVSDTLEEITVQDGVYDLYLLDNGEYTAQIDRVGNASNGFCVIKVTTQGAETTYHTLQIPVDTGLELKVELSGLTEPAVLEFIPGWGTSAYYGTTGNPLYLENNLLHITGAAVPPQNEEQQESEELQPTGPDTLVDETEQTTPPSADGEETVHIVKEGDLLALLAEEYGTTVEAIAQRNGIADKRTITIGQKLIIPLTKSK